MPKELSKDTLAGNGFEVAAAIEAHEPVGCVRCAFTGFKGRTGLYELMLVTDGMHTLREDGLERIRHGVTSVAEVLRVLGGSAAR